MTDDDRDFYTIAQSGWDAEDWAESQGAFPRLGEVELDLLEVASLGPWLLGDTFHALHKAAPQLRDDPAPRAVLNQMIAKELLDGQLDQIRLNTVGDPVLAAVAAVQMGPTLRQLLIDAQPLQDAADECEKARQDHEDAKEQAAEQEAAGEPVDTDLVDETGKVLGQAAADLADQLGAMGPVVTTAVSAAAEAASDKVDQMCQAAAGWGAGEGESLGADPADRLAMLERLSAEPLAELAKMVGRLRIDASARAGSHWDTGPAEIVDVEPSNNLSRLTARELVNLAVPELRPVFYDRYLNKKLMCLRMEEPQHEDAGTIIYVEDASSTMKGQRSLWARAVGIRLLETAVEQRRGFRAIVFSGVGKFKVFDFGDAGESTLDDRLAYAEFVMAGETDFQGPLTSALTFIEDEYDQLGRTHADIVLATDGIASCTDDFYAHFDAEKERMGFTCYGIVIQHTIGTAVARLCDKVTSEDRLADGAGIADLFDDITTKELVA